MSKDTYQEPVGYSIQFHCFSIHTRSAMGLACSSVHSPGRRAGCSGKLGTISHWHPKDLPRQGWWSSAHPLPQLGAVSLHTPAKSSRVFIVHVTNTNLLLNYISVRSSLSPNRNYYWCQMGLALAGVQKSMLELRHYQSTLLSLLLL